MNAVMVRRSEHATERKSEQEEAKRRSVWQNTMERERSGKRAESGAPCPLTANNQWCSGTGTHRNVVPINILGPERRSGIVICPPRRNAIAAAFRQMFAVKIGFAYSEIRPCLM